MINGSNLLGKTGKFSLFRNDIGGAEFQMRHEVLADHFVLGQGDGTDQSEQRPVAKVDTRVDLRMIGRLLNELQEELVEQTLLFHTALQKSLS